VQYVLLLLPDFLLIAMGFALCRFTALNASVWQQVEKLVYYCLFPALLFQSILKAPLDLGKSSTFVLAGLALGFTIVALSLSLPHWPFVGRKMQGRDFAASAQVGFRFNSFIILSLAQRLGGAEAMTLVALLIGVLVPLFNIAAVWPMAQRSTVGFGREIVRNPLVLSTSSALILNLIGVSMPSFLNPVLDRMGQASLGLGLMAAGAGMAWTALRDAKTLATAVLLVKHLAAPLIAWALARGFGLSPMETLVLLAFAATPTASSCFILASRMGFNGALVASLVTLSTVLVAASLVLALGFLR
jgi:hypothetical protein